MLLQGLVQKETKLKYNNFKSTPSKKKYAEKTRKIDFDLKREKNINFVLSYTHQMYNLHCLKDYFHDNNIKNRTNSEDKKMFENVLRVCINTRLNKYSHFDLIEDYKEIGVHAVSIFIERLSKTNAINSEKQLINTFNKFITDYFTPSIHRPILQAINLAKNELRRQIIDKKNLYENIRNPDIFLLNQYIINRKYEKSNNWWINFSLFSHSAATKISAAEKILSIINNTKYETLSYNEIAAINEPDSNLNRVFSGLSEENQTKINQIIAKQNQISELQNNEKGPVRPNENSIY